MHNDCILTWYRHSGFRFLAIISPFLVLLSPVLAFGQAVMRPQENQSTVRFVIKNFGLNVEGTITGISGEAVFDPQRAHEARFDISLKAATIQTGNRMRDQHLQKKDYLDVERYPEIRFRSTSVSKGSDPSQFIVEGSLSMKGLTRTVRIPFRAYKDGSGYRFEGVFQVNRRDFAVGSSSISLSDNLTIYLDVITR